MISSGVSSSVFLYSFWDVISCPIASFRRVKMRRSAEEHTRVLRNKKKITFASCKKKGYFSYKIFIEYFIDFFSCLKSDIP